MAQDQPKRVRRLRRWLYAAALAVVGFIAVSFNGCAERLFFYPSRSAFETPEGTEDVWFTNAQGLKLHGWFIPPEGEPDGPWPAVLHVHGNAGNMTDHVQFCEWLTEHGYAVMLFDYRSYGKSDRGPLNRDAVLTDANAALDTLLARGDIDPSRVAVYGFSLGGATATRLVGERAEPVALVAGAPFSGWQRVSGDYVPLLTKALIRDRGNPEEAIARIGDRPVLLLHGTSDGIVRPYHTERLLEAATNAGVNTRRETYEGLDHNGLLVDDAVRSEILRFLTDAVP